MPTDACGSIHQPLECVHVANTAQPLEEGKATAPHSGLVQGQKICIRHRAVDIRDTSVFSIAPGDGVGNDAIIKTVHGCIDDDGTFDTDFFVQRAKH